MKWIRMRNTGSFDIVKAISMIGCSVKQNSDCIGLFGSGSKYALAQALRQNITIKICCDGKSYTLCGTSEEFRGKSFEMVSLRSNTGSLIKTSISSDFGKEDWHDKFFILREFYSNMLDENGICEIVDKLGEPEFGFVDIYLPYSEFSVYFDNIEHWFNKKPNKTVMVGSGIVYKKGVRVGQLDGIKLDIWHDDVRITECRAMEMYSAESKLGDVVESSIDEDVWKAFFESPKSTEISVWVSDTNIKQPVHNALVALYGSNYVICANAAPILDMVVADGKVPVIFSEKWSMKCLGLPNYLDICKDIGTREMTSEESAQVHKVLKSIEFMAGKDSYRIKVISDTELKRLGSANIGTGEICLNPENFKDIRELTKTLIHEIGHIRSKCGDLDRGFTDFFVSAIADLVL